MRDLLDCQSERRASLLNIDQASGVATAKHAAPHVAAVDRNVRVSFLTVAVNRYCEHLQDGLTRSFGPVAMSNVCLLIENADDLEKWASELIIEAELARIGAQRGASSLHGNGSARDRDAEVLQLTAAVRTIQAAVVAMHTGAGATVDATGDDAVTLPAALFDAGGQLAGPGAPQNASGSASGVRAS